MEVVVEAKGLSRRYGRFWALRDLDLTLPLYRVVGADELHVGQLIRPRRVAAQVLDAHVHDAVAGFPADYAPHVLANTLAPIATLADTDTIVSAWQKD